MCHIIMLLCRYATRTVLIVAHLFLWEVLFIGMLRSLKQVIEDILLWGGGLYIHPGSPWKPQMPGSFAFTSDYTTRIELTVQN